MITYFFSGKILVVYIVICIICSIFYLRKTKDSYQAIRKNHYLCLRFGCRYLAK